MIPPSARVTVLEGPAEVARAAAARIVEVGARAVSERDTFRIGLSGGRTPALLYQLLAFGAGGTFDWHKVLILFADERAVPPSHRDSNFRLVDTALAEPLGLRPNQIVRMRGEAADLEVAAREYESHLIAPLDLLVLGMGEDGHTASLFPDSPLLDDLESRVATVKDAPKPPPRRITVLPRVIREARSVLMMVSGAEKAEAVLAALGETGDVRRCPARLARDGEWLLDRAAGIHCADQREHYGAENLDPPLEPI